MKKLASLLLMVVLAFNLTACSSSEDALSDILGNDSSSETDIYPEDGYAEGRFGSVMHTYFFNYTVNSAYLCNDYNGYVPADGNTLLVADITVKNTFSESIEMYDTDFQIQWGDDDNEEAYDFPITFYVDPVSDEQLPGTYELAINEEKTGILVFEVPAGNTDFSISYLELFSDDSEGDVYFVYFTAKEQ
uniref:DUF4352 domain-containing protein n=1 Tax=Acetatifactor sp. TaxID=1872090 RepID=UPI004055D56C